MNTKYIARIVSIYSTCVLVPFFLLSSCNNDGKVYTLGGVSFKMVYVEGGVFMMGAQNLTPSVLCFDPEAQRTESPAHPVSLSPYYIGETEVTQALWTEVMGYNPSFSQMENCPVENVSYNEIVGENGFLEKLNGRMRDHGLPPDMRFSLPTEAQWEFASKGGNKSRNYKYSGSDTLALVGWAGRFAQCSGQANGVAQKLPNELGIYDMSGNVWEWCADSYYDYSDTLSRDPFHLVSVSTLRIVRGGAYDNSESCARPTCRSVSATDYKYSNLGFRLALCKEKH